MEDHLDPDTLEIVLEQCKHRMWHFIRVYTVCYDKSNLQGNREILTIGPLVFLINHLKPNGRAHHHGGLVKVQNFQYPELWNFKS